MADFLQTALQKIRDTASSLGKAYNAYANNPTVKSIGDWENKNIVQPIYNGVTNIPKIQLPATFLPPAQTKIPIVNSALNLGSGLIKGAIEGPLNIPRDTAVGYARLNREAVAPLIDKRPVSGQNVLAGVGNLAEAGLNLSTLGIGKNLLKTGGEQMLKTGIGQAIKEGAISGAGYGTAFGAANSVGNQYNKPFDWKEVATSTAGGALLGSVLGGAISGIGALKGVIFPSEGASKVEAQLRKADGEWVKGTVPIKPDGMAQKAWEFQLAFNAKYDRSPYKPVYPSDLAAATKYEAESRAGMTVRDISKPKIPGSVTENVSQQPVSPSIKGEVTTDMSGTQSHMGESVGGKILTTEALPIKTGPLESGTQITNLQDVPSSTPIISDRLKTAQELLSNEKTVNQTSAELAQNTREQFSNETIKDINLLKRVSGGKKFQEGDIETFRQEYPQITEKVVEAVRENPQYTNLTDSEALQVALELPTKQMTKVKSVDSSKVKILTREQKLENQQWDKEFGIPETPAEANRQYNEWNKAVDDYANGITRTKGGVSVEPSFATKGKIKTRESVAQAKARDVEYKAWQKQVFGEANSRTSDQAIEDLAKQMKTSTNHGILDSADVWKDKPRAALTNETMERNFTDIMGKDAPELKDKLIEPVFEANAERTRFLNKERAEIKALDIKPRSTESKLVQELGEGKITTKDLPKESASKIINAESVLRQKYDSYLTKLNKVLTRNGYDPIPKRKDYFHHFEELNGIFDQVGVSIKATDLPTDINGLSADFKPGKTFFNAALQRKGTQTNVDAITGIDRYLEGASKQIYLTDSIQNLRAFETAIREKYAGTDHLSNFVADLTEYTNGIAGKKAMLDRAAESLVGRRVYAGANLLKKQTGANMVGFNVASAATNTIPIVETLATTNKISVAQAMLNIFKSTFKDDGFVGKSDFLTSRLGSDRLSLNAWEKAQRTGYWIFKTIDNFTSQLVVRSKYLEGLKKGLSEESAMKAANTWGRKLLAGRTAGEMPTLYNSKTAGFLTQFQLEVNNQWSFMAKDIPRNFSPRGAASALGQLFLYSYIYNNIYEKMFGRRPAIDPVGVGLQAYQDYTNPNMKKGQATKNLASNVVNQLPYIGSFTGGRIPVSGAIPNPFAVISGDSTWQKEAAKPFKYLFPPTGGSQASKLIEGVTAYSKGASMTPSGNVRYPIPQTPVNLIRTATAGQYSTPEARQYFREGRLPLGTDQTQEFMQTPVDQQQGYYNDVINTRQSNATETKVDEAFMNGDTSVQQTGNIYRYKDDEGKLQKIKTGTVSKMPDQTPYQKALKEDAAYKLVDSIISSSLKDTDKQQALADIGISQEDASYYNIAKQSVDVKTVFVTDELSKVAAGSTDRNTVLNYLAGLRNEVNGTMILANGVVDQLYQDNVISKAEQTMLKNLTIKNGQVVKARTTPKKVTIKTVSAPKSSSVKIRTMKQLLASNPKIRTKKFGFTTKVK